jgi:hypothetical protein
MKQIFQIIGRHTQRVVLIFWLLTFGLPNALLAEASRLVENAPTEEVCTLAGGTIAEVVTKKRKKPIAASPAAHIHSHSVIFDFVQATYIILSKPALEITLRKLRI